MIELAARADAGAVARIINAAYSRLGYVQISVRAFDEPLLAGPTDMRTYRKSLRAAPAT